MAKQTVTPATAWVANSTNPFADQSFQDGDRSGTESITGTGFGSAADVILFDRMDAYSDGLISTLTGPDIGEYIGYDNVTFGAINQAYAITDDGRKWLANRKPTDVALDVKNSCGFKWANASHLQDFTFSFRMRVPDGFKFTNAVSTNTLGGTASRLKMHWMYDSDVGELLDDLVVFTIIGDTSNRVAGNAVSPTSVSEGFIEYDFSEIDCVNDNLFLYSQTRETSGGANDGIIETMQVTPSFYDRTVLTDCDPFNGSGPFAGYNEIILSAWLGRNAAPLSFADDLMGYADIYISEGANHRARVITHDAATLAASTEMYIVPHDTWSSTEVTFTPVAREDLTFRSLILGDGTLRENV